jgi:hypothetical protein
MGYKFQTEVQIPDYPWRTGYKKQNLFIGSCFTENVGNKMANLKYPVDINPFGILYNPVSVANGLRFLLQKKTFSKNELIQHNGLWHSMFHHSRFSSTNAGQVLAAINERIDSSSELLRKSGFMFLTFGTAWVYEYKPTGEVVSNCHKIPGKNFHRFRLTPEKVVELYQQLLPEVWKVQPEMKVVFTVSPIRHWKDGAIENQRSKAILLLAVSQLVNIFGEEKCNYFPAYEIVMDELRDYRFYEADMIHLSPVAVNHIWERFQSALIDEESRKIAEQVKKFVCLLNHRPLNMFTLEHLDFLNQSMQKGLKLQEKFPYLDLKMEIKLLSEQITGVREGIKNL